MLLALSTVSNAIEVAIGSVKSPNGNRPEFWVSHTIWEHRASTADVKNDNLVKLNKVLDRLGEYLAPDQCDELHANLYSRVQEASLANGIVKKDMKRLKRDDLLSWLKHRVKDIQHPTHSGGSGQLQRKLSSANIDDTSIATAKELRRLYVAEARTQKYLTLEDRELFEGEVLASLHCLKSRLDAGEFSDDGRQFLTRCQSELKILRDSMTGTKPPNSILYGYLYEVMNRCLHRLARVLI